jgi:Chain length determinant protein
MKTLTADYSPVALLDDKAAKWHERRVKSSFGAVRRRLWLIVLLGCVGLGGSATWLTVAKPEYSATALVQVDTRNKVSSFDNVVTSPKEVDPSVIRTEVEVLRSNAIVERVVKALNLTNDPEFRPPPPRTWVAKVGDLLPEELRTFFKSLGILQVNNGGTSGSLGGGTAADNGTLAVDRTAAPRPDNQITGTSLLPPAGTRTTVNENDGVSGSLGPPSAAGAVQDMLNEDELALTIRQVKKNISVEADGRSYIITINFAASSSERPLA